MWFIRNRIAIRNGYTFSDSVRWGCEQWATPDFGLRTCCPHLLATFRDLGCEVGRIFAVIVTCYFRMMQTLQTQTSFPPPSCDLQQMHKRKEVYKLADEVRAQLEIGGEELIHQIGTRWRRLCAEVRSPPFYRPEWIAAWVRSFEPNSNLVLLTATAGDDLVAVLPMVRKKCFYAGVPVIKLIGTANSHSIHFDILRRTDVIGDLSLRAMWLLLSDTPGWHVLELPRFPEGGACKDLMALAERDGCLTQMVLVQNSPVLRFRISGDGGPATPVGGPSRHFRHELRRFARVLASATGSTPTVRRCSDANPHLLNRFFELEQSGWKGREGSAINCQPQTRSFYRQIAKAGADNGYFCLHSLEANGAMAAGAFSIATRDGFFPMKIAHDESLRRGGPGHLLFKAIVAECAERQIPELFFGGTNEHYKTLWTQQTLPQFSALVFSQDFRSRVAYRVRKNILTPLGKLRRLV